MAKQIVPILNAAPDWEPHLSEFVTLWHGCTVSDKNDVERHGIDVTKSAVDTDFGQGFYTTTLERQARHWAWERFYVWQDRNPTATGNQPVVLRFRVRRYSVKPRDRVGSLDLNAGLDELLSLQFVRGDYDHEDYWSLVQHCRRSIPADLITGQPAVVNNHQRPSADWYEMVSGPVAAFWTQRVAIIGADQFSFHGKGIELLQALIDEGKPQTHGGKGHGDYYQWLPVH